MFCHQPVSPHILLLQHLFSDNEYLPSRAHWLLKHLCNLKTLFLFHWYEFSLLSQLLCRTVVFRKNPVDRVMLNYNKCIFSINSFICGLIYMNENSRYKCFKLFKIYNIKTIKEFPQICFNNASTVYIYAQYFARYMFQFQVSIIPIK